MGKFWKKIGPTIKLVGIGALSGAVDAVVVDNVTPDFHGKSAAIGTVALLGAVKGAVTVLKRSPLDKRAEEWPDPQQRPERD